MAATPGLPCPASKLVVTRNRIAIMIADDHAILRESLAVLLQSQPDFDAMGAAANGEEALRLAREHCPEVLMLDPICARKATVSRFCVRSIAPANAPTGRRWRPFFSPSQLPTCDRCHSG